MLFQSPQFLFIFLPATLFAYFLAGKFIGKTAAHFVLAAASILFYASWRLPDTGLLLALVIFNYSVYRFFLRKSADRPETMRFRAVATGVAVNVATLVYFKYTGFMVANIEALTGVSLGIVEPLMPLAISFFIFQKIAYLVDAYRNQLQDHSAGRFTLFVFFFPQLIAGPIVHFREVNPSFSDERTISPIESNILAGLIMFGLGLFKKVILADSFATYASPIFDFADKAAAVDAYAAWLGALSYTFQIYFDFSGYSDMAIGLALLFNVRLPVNFDSPYRSTSIIGFWKAWHITLSRFLLEYLYIPLGGNRRGALRRHVNLLATMLIGGIWHGAGWTFLIWGGLHGIFLIVNHMWRTYAEGAPAALIWLFSSWRAGLLTLVAVVIAWVPFRANTLQGSVTMLKGMAGLSGATPPFFDPWPMPAAFLVDGRILASWSGLLFGGAWIILGAAIVLVLPNVWRSLDYQPMHSPLPTAATPTALDRAILDFYRRRPLLFAAGAGFLFALGIGQVLSGSASPFLYFQF
ncbi:MBOAT family O-acyltransferase [Rhodoblastus sp. 17X3]|uniref:MBOAT family O-acyltransferase n=1 Tax=Rhodoblastus sp. 17X3 TaxID=3047026 RepID=UPI0024B7E74F|nr:MBOAT family O-acyltransferase [Rhodoblastus sp. 17X3]MDI9848583.1 MBOAT family O-acyltransferase [Rhodoblastus sp. 17X3]